MDDRLGINDTTGGGVKEPEKCPTCEGKGYIDAIDIMTAQRSRKSCVDCMGTGAKDGKMTGIRSYHPHSQVFQYVEEGVVWATLELWQHSTKEGYNYFEIHKMITKRKHRKKGVMSVLLLAVMRHPYIWWIETSYSDSTEQGREWLMKRGFKKEGDKLIHRRKGAPKGANSKPETLGKNDLN